MRFIAIAAALVLLLCPGRVVAQQDDDPLTVYLLTMGTGDMVWEKYGHNALWVRDDASGTDRVYNYGVFDFDSPGYWGRFIRGDWLYELAVSDIEFTLYQYAYLNRTVVAQELALSPAQKAELAEFLEWNARPENREYLYDYFRDNCSTRLRDVLDMVLGGQLRQATEGEPTGTSFRWHSRRLMAGEPVVYTALNAGLGPEADQPIDAWQEMFLPEKLQQRIGELQVTMVDGSSQPLVRSERVLYEAEGRAPDRTVPPAWIPVFLAIGILVAGLLIALARFADQGSRAARFGFGLLATGWSLLIGVGGLLLTALWAFTNHTAAHRNENLLQFDPLAIGLLVLIPAAMLGVRWARRPARILALAVAGISVLGFVLQILPGVDQVNGEVIALILPVHLALAWGVVRLMNAGERTSSPRGAGRPSESHGTTS